MKTDHPHDHEEWRNSLTRKEEEEILFDYWLLLEVQKTRWYKFKRSVRHLLTHGVRLLLHWAALGALLRFIAKGFFCILFLLVAASCGPNTTDRYLVTRTCLKSHNETKWEYHYGATWMNGYKFTYHYGPHTINVCDQVQVDSTLNLHYVQR